MEKLTWQKATPADKVRMIQEVWEPGFSSAQVGEKLGVTRTAIIGIYGRHVKLKVSHPLRIATRGLGAKKQTLKPVEAVKAPPPPPPPVPAGPAPLNKLLEELEWGNCKWPVNDGGPFLFCGRPSTGSYCPYHQKLNVREYTRPVVNKGVREHARVL